MKWYSLYRWRVKSTLFELNWHIHLFTHGAAFQHILSITPNNGTVLNMITKLQQFHTSFPSQQHPQNTFPLPISPSHGCATKWTLVATFPFRKLPSVTFINLFLANLQLFLISLLGYFFDSLANPLLMRSSQDSLGCLMFDCFPFSIGLYTLLTSVL